MNEKLEYVTYKSCCGNISFIIFISRLSKSQSSRRLTKMKITENAKYESLHLLSPSLLSFEEGGARWQQALQLALGAFRLSYPSPEDGWALRRAIGPIGGQCQGLWSLIPFLLRMAGLSISIKLVYLPISQARKEKLLGFHSIWAIRVNLLEKI